MAVRSRAVERGAGAGVVGTGGLVLAGEAGRWARGCSFATRDFMLPSGGGGEKVGCAGGSRSRGGGGSGSSAAAADAPTAADAPAAAGSSSFSSDDTGKALR